MRFEHKLPLAVAAYAASAKQQLTEIRTQYLIGLGIAKENELRADVVRQALSQQLAIVEESEGLPKPVEPYRLSDDGRSLVGEVAEAPPARSPADLGSIPVAPPPAGPNGVAHG